MGSMVVMTVPEHDELVKLGYQAVLKGGLSDLREKTHLTRNAQARLIGVDAEALRDWENLHRSMNVNTALRVGEWFWGAQKALEDPQSQTLNFDDLIPASAAAQYLSIATEKLEAEIHGLAHENLGVLGFFVYRTQIPKLAD